MKELINIINDKLFKVIDELKEQRSNLETKLAAIKEDIDSKVKVASEYKDNVEKSNNIISDLEDKISKLKQDLQDLHDKFEAAGFIELIEAGNKEINGKIIEYNTKIEEEQDTINKLQDEASNLKDELITLKDSKDNIENELHNTIIALNYYNSKIEEITVFASEHADKLDEFTPEDDSNELSTDDIDVEKIIDGTIFEEIDSITTEDKELSDEDIETILNSDDKNEVDKESDKEEIPEDLSVTQELNDVINQTNELILNETIIDNNSEEKFLSQLNDDEDDKPEITIEEEKEDNNDLVKLDLSALDDNDEDEVIEEESSIDVSSILRELGLDPESFVEDTSKLSHIDVNNATKIINTLDKHFIDINNIYSYPSILMTIKDDVLNNILNKLEELGCVPTTITYIFKYLDKIDLDKLNTYNGETTSIINVLDDVIPEMDKKDIVQEIGLSDVEGEMLKSKLSEEELDAMNTFPEIVKTNYNTLKGLNINELNKCFTEHPKRFMDNPDIFEGMLDKYDPEDLIRCINKNVAVIDKL
jgi:hypothetical protein